MSETICSTGDSRETTSTRSQRGRSVIAFLAAFAVLAAAGVWVKSGSDRLRVLENSLQSSSPETANMARDLHRLVLEMNGALLRFQLSEDDSEKELYRTKQLQAGLLAERNRVRVRGAERQAINDLGKTLAAYFVEMETHLEPLRGGVRRGTAALLSASIDEKSKTLLAELKRVEEAQDAAVAAALASARTSLQMKRSFLWSLLALFGVLFFALAWTASRPRSRFGPDSFDPGGVLRRQEKLASLGVLAAGVAHEIRNPLTAIKFRLFSLKKEFGADLAANEDYRTVNAEVDRLEKIVKNFLEFARPAEPRLASVDVSEILRGVRSLLQPEMKKRRIMIQVDAPEAMTIEADPQQIRQVIINLAQNAADSIAGEGSITLRARHGAASLLHRSEPMIILEVTDTGQGIAPDAEARLFDPFFSTKEGGTGLGLPIAARIAEKHGGYIQYSTQRGRGATFSVFLPKTPAKESKSDEGANPPDRR